MMKDVKGYEGKYKINECGIVINKKGHVMRPAINHNGYFRVALEDKDSTHRTNESVHRLVAKTFIENDDPEHKNVVMHIDNDPLNNHVSNLKWGTQSENVQQAFDQNRKMCNMKFVNITNIYEVYNDNTGDVIRCNGRLDVAELIQYEEISLKNLVVNNREIAIGPYKGYKIRRTGESIKTIKPFIKI